MVVINIFALKPDALDDFLAVEIAALPSLRAGAAGVRGNCLFRAADSSEV